MSYPNNDKPSIFVQIPSYRDKECIPTVRGVFAKAKYPERIFVGICWQYDADQGDAPLVFDERKDQVRILNLPAKESKGVAWGRHQAQLLWQGEDYVLQIDSHTLMVPGWDEKMLEELQLCPSTKAVLSCPPHGYTAPDLVRKDSRPTFRRPKGFTDVGGLALVSDFFDAPLSQPAPAAFVVPRFIFSSSELIKQVPVDPYLYIEEEDVTLSARMWTHGWDIYSPGKILLYHLYNNDGNQRPLHWKEHTDWAQLQAISRQRYRYVMGIDIPKAHEKIAELAKYAPGKERSLREYSAFCGIDFVHKQPIANANHCPFIEGIRQFTSAPSYWLEPSVSVAANESQDNWPVVEISQPMPIAEGDFIPFFSLEDETGKKREIQLYGGHHVALYFIPNAQGASFTALCDGFTKHKKALASYDLTPIGIIPCSPAELGALKEKGDMRLWSDAERVVGNIFGAYDNDVVCFLLSPNLQVRKIYRLDSGDIAAHFAQLEDDCSTLFPVDAPHVAKNHAPVLVVPHVLSKERCEKLIAYWHANEKFQGKVGADVHSTYNKSAKIRSDVMIKGELQAKLDEVLSGTLFPEIEKVFGLEVTRREEYKIGCYDAEEGGFFNQHRDNFESSLSHRRYAMTLNLNDDFEGGGLNFPEYGQDVYKTEAGSAVIFPCSLMHRATKVAKGKRFMLVSFFYGEEEAMKRFEMLKKENKKVSLDDRRILSARKDIPGKIPLSRAGVVMPSLASSMVAGAPSFIPQLNRQFDIMKEGVPPGILVIKNFLDPGVCQVMKDYADATISRKLEVVDNERSTKEKTVTKPSDSRITEYVKIDGIVDRLLPLFIHIHTQVLEPFYDVKFEWFERPQILRYTAGGKYGQHADSEHLNKETKQWVRAQDRDYSTLTYLNEEYGGGEIYFNEFDFKVKPTTGMLVAFPSDHRYLHTALPTTSGIRYVIVSWSAILGTPRVKERPPYAVTFLRLPK